MSLFTATEIAEQIVLWKKALAALSLGQGYRIGGRWLTRADLPEVRVTLDWLAAKQGALEGRAGLQVMVGRPRR